jgi:hypothetical protein
VVRVPTPERHVRRTWTLPVFSFLATLSFVMVSVIDPTSGVAADVETYATAERAPVQQFAVKGDVEHGVETASYEIIEPEPEPEPEPAPAPTAASGFAPPAGTPDPGTAQAIAADMVAARGWGGGEFDCLVALWNKESGWNVYAMNPYSGAYGIPQSLPGNTMATAGADWQTNPATQITWGLNYIQGRYGSPCGAWAHSQQVGWY